MDGQIISLSSLVERVKAGAMTDEQVETQYGVDTLRRVYDTMQEHHYQSHYA